MRRGERGFSMIELMVTVIVVGVLAAIAVPGLSNRVNYSKRPEAMMGLGTIARMQAAFHQTRGYYASSIDQLGFTMDGGEMTGPNTWVGRRYTFSITTMNNGQNYVATAVGNIDGDEFQDILFAAR